jgi:FMN-dependent NADH-azoreductase
MKNILHIISSPRTGISFSTKLGKAIIENLIVAYPSSKVVERDLTIDPFPHLQQKHLDAFFTRPENRTEINATDIKHSETAIEEIKRADVIIISVDVYNFNIHSTLKAWIDHIVRSGITFKLADTGVEGLLTDKKVYLAVASKGVYSEGPMKQFDFVVPYLRFVLNFIGINDIEVLRVEGSSIPAEQETILEKSLNEWSLIA